MPQLDPFAAAALQTLPSEIMAAVVVSPMPGLGDGPLDSNLAAAIANGTDIQWADVTANNRSLSESGLWLLAGELDRSHQISQENHSAMGSFWHGIMHRREGDFENAKYWFRRAGDHELLQQIRQWSDGAYRDPFEFVDAVRRAVRSGREADERCKLLQWIEWQSLMVLSVSG